MPKSLKLFDHVETIQAESIKYISPNQFELEAMYDTIQTNSRLKSTPLKENQYTVTSLKRNIKNCIIENLKFIRLLITRCTKIS